MCVDETNGIGLNERDKEWDFRIWYESDTRTIWVTPHWKMCNFWRTEGFERMRNGLWVQSDCVFYEGYLDVIKEKAKENGLVFQYCDVQKNPNCKYCDRKMRILTARRGEAWNVGRNFFKCYHCKHLDTFMWIDGTEAFSDASMRRCGECDEDFGYGGGCLLM